jgi:hypothetical protein
VSSVACIEGPDAGGIGRFAPIDDRCYSGSGGGYYDPAATRGENERTEDRLVGLVTLPALQLSAARAGLAVVGADVDVVVDVARPPHPR